MNNFEWKINLPKDINPENWRWMQDWIDIINDSKKRVQRERKLKRILNESERFNTKD